MDETPLDPQKYGELLAQTLPSMIDSPEEHERLLTIAETLMDKGEALSKEERKLLELLVLLIEVFENEVEEAEAAEASEEAEPPEPHETLQRLLTARGWQPLALNDIFGNPKLVAEVLAGRRAITRGQGRALGELFKVPPKLFLRRPND
jgi:antitoxin component HigA of HigAB toxin-antitoxin module